MQILFSHSGDSSVGIPGETAKVTIDGVDWSAFGATEEEAKEFFSEAITRKLEGVFQELWQFPVESERVVYKVEESDPVYYEELYL